MLLRAVSPCPSPLPTDTAQNPHNHRVCQGPNPLDEHSTGPVLQELEQNPLYLQDTPAAAATNHGGVTHRCSMCVHNARLKGRVVKREDTWEADARARPGLTSPASTSSALCRPNGLTEIPLRAVKMIHIKGLE